MTLENAAAKSPGTLVQRAEEKTTGSVPRSDGLGEPTPAPKSQRLSSTLDHAGVGIAEIDAEGRLLRVNSHLCGLMGYGSEELIGRSIFDETEAGDAEIDRARFRRQVAGEIDRYTMEKRLRRKDGSYFWASINSSSVLNPAGQFLYAVRVQLDITDRKRAETALSERMDEQGALFAFTEVMQHARSANQVHEAALDAILRALRCDRAAILLTDDAGVMRFVAARGLSERYQRAVEGHSPWLADEPRPQPVTIADIARAELPESLRGSILAEGIAAVAFIPLHQNRRLLGKFMAYYDRPHVFAETEIDVAVALARQLGFGLERMQAEHAAHHLAAIVESSDDAIISKSLDGIIQTWNKGAERIFGYAAPEVIGRPINILIPADRQNEEPEILFRIRAGERVEHFETIRQRKDGCQIDISLSISPIRDEWGRIVGASKIARDITGRKEAEAKLRILLSELNHRVKNNMQMLQALLSNAARNTEHPEAKQLLGEASDRLAAMAAAQRVLYGTADAARFDGREFLNAVCKTAQHAFPDGIRIEHSSDVARLPNDSAMPLALILNELLTNAVKHGMKGRPGTVQVGLERDGDGFVLFVADQGPGFDLESVVRRSSGLHLVQGLARQLRGRFEVHRNPTRCLVRFA